MREIGPISVGWGGRRDSECLTVMASWLVAKGDVGYGLDARQY